MSLPVYKKLLATLHPKSFIAAVCIPNVRFRSRALARTKSVNSIGIAYPDPGSRCSQHINLPNTQSLCFEIDVAKRLQGGWELKRQLRINEFVYERSVIGID